MKYEDLKLGDVVEVDTTNRSGALIVGYTTVIGLDTKGKFNLPVMIGWKKSDTVSERDMHDTWVSTGTYLPNAKNDFQGSYWVSLSCIISRQMTPGGVKEKPCGQCSKMNDVGVNNCWWCEGKLK